MEITSVVNYEGTHSFELLKPDSDEPMGITVEVRSTGSAHIRNLVLESTDKQIERFAKKKLPTAMQGLHSEIEKTAALIVSWKWGTDPETGEPNKFNGNPNPELTKKNAMEFVKVNWIYDQITEQASKVKNFMKGSD